MSAKIMSYSKHINNNYDADLNNIIDCDCMSKGVKSLYHNNYYYTNILKNFERLIYNSKIHQKSS